MKTVYLLTGVPGSGKTWVCNQLKHKFLHIAHDDFKDNNRYVRAILDAASQTPILAETPFSMSQIMEPLQDAGINVVPIVINEEQNVLSDRYEARDGKPIPKGHLTRQLTYIDRAIIHGWFYGTSEEVLNHLKALK